MRSAPRSLQGCRLLVFPLSGPDGIVWSCVVPVPTNRDCPYIPYPRSVTRSNTRCYRQFSSQATESTVFVPTAHQPVLFIGYEPLQLEGTWGEERGEGEPTEGLTNRSCCRSER